jgi:hypothetical protein
MLYLGHFTFDAPHRDNDDDEPQHGYFSVLAQADDVDAAFDTFRRLIPRVGRNQEIFEAGTQVWLDSCVEVRKLPADGLLAHMVVALGEHGSMSASLVGAPAGTGEAYGWGVDPDDAHGGSADPSGGSVLRLVEPVADIDDGRDADDVERDDDAHGALDREDAVEPFLVIE